MEVVKFPRTDQLGSAMIFCDLFSFRIVNSFGRHSVPCPHFFPFAAAIAVEPAGQSISTPGTGSKLRTGYCWLQYLLWRNQQRLHEHGQCRQCDECGHLRPGRRCHLFLYWPRPMISSGTKATTPNETSYTVPTTAASANPRCSGRTNCILTVAGLASHYKSGRRILRRGPSSAPSWWKPAVPWNLPIRTRRAIRSGSIAPRNPLEMLTPGKPWNKCFISRRPVFRRNHDPTRNAKRTSPGMSCTSRLAINFIR